MRYEITLNGKVYEVEVDDNRALLGAIEQARPLSDEELAEHPALARRMVSNITRAASAPRPAAVAPIRSTPAGAPGGPVAGGAPVARGAAPAGRPITRPATAGAAPRGTNAAPASAPPTSSAKGEPVPAPMPGLIKEIKVQPGQQIKAGQVLIILEAMKMENEIVAPRDAMVTGVSVSKGQTVSAGAHLLSLA